MKTHQEVLERRLRHIQAREHKNSYDMAEIAALEFAIESLKIIFADPELKNQLKTAVKERRVKP